MKNKIFILFIIFFLYSCGERKDSLDRSPFVPGDYAVLKEANITVQIKDVTEYTKNNAPNGFKYSVRIVGTQYDISGWVYDYDLFNNKISNVPAIPDLK